LCPVLLLLLDVDVDEDAALPLVDASSGTIATHTRDAHAVTRDAPMAIA
jgi:hypothetical protein